MAWYTPQQTLSYNAFLSMVIGNRGGGKSFAWKEQATRHFIRSGRRTIWLRRYDTELRGRKGDKNGGLIKSFFQDITTAGKFTGHKLETKGYNAYVDDKPAIEFVALSTSSALKSKSFDDVDYIVFDEFLIDKSTYKYLTNEVTVLLEFIETVFRKRDNGRVILLGNAMSFANPYFLYFNVKPFRGAFYSDRARSLLVQMFKDADYIAEKKASKFGRLISGTEYSDYAIDNEFLLDNNKFIAAKPAGAKFRCGLTYSGATYGFWIDYSQGLMYASKSYPETSRELYTLTRTDHDINRFLVKNVKGTFLSEVLFCFREGLLRFEDIIVKTQIFEALSYFTR